MIARIALQKYIYYLHYKPWPTNADFTINHQENHVDLAIKRRGNGQKINYGNGPESGNSASKHLNISPMDQHALGMIFFDGFTLRHTAMKIIS